jgi:hypothetical protein
MNDTVFYGGRLTVIQTISYLKTIKESGNLMFGICNALSDCFNGGSLLEDILYIEFKGWLESVLPPRVYGENKEYSFPLLDTEKRKEWIDQQIKDLKKLEKMRKYES